MDKTLKQLVQCTSLRKPEAVHSPDVVMSAAETEELNLRRISARDAYSYALQVMDILFTKEEMGHSLLFKSKKSSKPGLDQKRVEQLLGLVDKKFGDKWDIKILTQKANQKCRDSYTRSLKTPEQNGDAGGGASTSEANDAEEAEASKE